MNTDGDDAIEGAGPGIGPGELAACLATLRALRARPDLGRSGDPRVAEILGHAAGLIRAANARDRADAGERDRELSEGAGIRLARNAVGVEAAPAEDGRGVPFELARPRRCYACKRPAARPHAFYDALCPACGAFHLARRSQSADLAGAVALVTGARVKIGYQVALKLLRAGAAVVGTSRFPVDAAARFAAVPDFAAWGDRLSILGIDLRHLGAVERFADTLAGRLPRLDVLINNAAQTIRRPPAFYRHLLEAERLGPEALPPPARRLLAGPPIGAEPDPLPAVVEGAGLPLTAALTQIRLIPEDFADDPATFPPGRLDADGQQVDRRARNSWTLSLGEVTPVELVEAHAVNCLAPFLLIRGLEPLMRRDPGRPRFIVNVSAMEGHFRRGPETGRHPHTNMAKAALDMITRTSAGRLAAAGIFMNSVDTGWITDMFPGPEAEARAARGSRPPLDEVDGAARVCDPVFAGINSGQPVFGKFLKDYREVEW